MTIYRAVWGDGYISNIVETKQGFRLEGGRRKFKLMSELETYYGGRYKITNLNVINRL